MFTFSSFKEFGAELNENSFLKVIPETRIVFFIKSSIWHRILDMLDSFLDFFFWVVEISDNNFADILSVVI